MPPESATEVRLALQILHLQEEMSRLEKQHERDFIRLETELRENRGKISDFEKMTQRWGGVVSTILALAGFLGFAASQWERIISWFAR